MPKLDYSTATRCTRGHDLTLPDAVGTSSCGKRRCMACNRLNNKKLRRAARKRRHRDADMRAQATERDIVRTVLDLYEQRERAATWWDREAITEQITALQQGRRQATGANT